MTPPPYNYLFDGQLHLAYPLTSFSTHNSNLYVFKILIICDICALIHFFSAHFPLQFCELLLEFFIPELRVKHVDHSNDFTGLIPFP